MLTVLLSTIDLIAVQGLPDQSVTPELDAIYRQYVTRPGIGGNVDRTAGSESCWRSRGDENAALSTP